jgi:acyl carrier protein
VPADAAAALELPSLSLVVVAEELEARFGFVVAARELVAANFGSLEALAAYCGRKRAGLTPPAR